MVRNKNDFWMDIATDHPIITYGFRDISEMVTSEFTTLGHHIALTGTSKVGEIFRVAAPNTYTHNSNTVINLSGTNLQAISQTRLFTSMIDMLQDTRGMAEFNNGDIINVIGIGRFEVTLSNDNQYTTVGGVRLYDLQRRTVVSAIRLASQPPGTVGFLDGIAYRSDPNATGSASATNDIGVDGLVFASSSIYASEVNTTTNGVSVQDALDDLYSILDTPTGIVPISLGGTGATLPEIARHNLGAGDVSGPGNSVSGNIALFDGTAGNKLRVGPNPNTFVDITSNQTVTGYKTFTGIAAQDEISVIGNTISRLYFRPSVSGTIRAGFTMNYNTNTFSMNTGNASTYGLSINGNTGLISPVNGAKFAGDGSGLTNLPLSPSLGINQTYYSVISNRVAGTTYRNTTGIPIGLIISGSTMITEWTTTSADIQVSTNGSTWMTLYYFSGRSGGGTAFYDFSSPLLVIPNNMYYRITSTYNPALQPIITSWLELR